MKRGGICPVCEIPHDAKDGANAVTARDEHDEDEQPSSLLGALWQSGRLAVGVAAVCFLVSTVLPIVSVARADEHALEVPRTALSLIIGDGPYGRELKSMSLLAVPGAAAMLVSLLTTRRTRSAMMASRPLLLVIAILPSLAAILIPLKIARRGRFDFAIGPSLIVIFLGTVFALLGGLRFGRGCSDPPPRRAFGDED